MGSRNKDKSGEVAGGVRLQDRLDGMLRGYLRDLPDSDFQEGALATVIDMAREFGIPDVRILAAAMAILKPEVSPRG